MRITIAHNKTKAEVIRAVDRSFDDLFRIGVVQIADEKRKWDGSTLTFSFTAKMSLLTSPIKGTVDVTDRDVTIDADLGLLEKLLPTRDVQSKIEGKIKGLLT